MPLLDRFAILSVQDLTTVDVDVPEWKGSVRVRTLTGTERDDLFKSMRAEDGKVSDTQFRDKLLSRCIVGDDGGLLFSESDLLAIGAKNSVALARVFQAADKLNSVGAAAVESVEKN